MNTNIFYIIKEADTNSQLFASTCPKDIKREMIRQARRAITIWHGDKFLGKWDWVNFKLTKVE